MKLKQRKTLSPVGIIISKRREEAEGAFYQGYKPTALVVDKTIQILDYYGYISFLKTSFHYNVFIPI